MRAGAGQAVRRGRYARSVTAPMRICFVCLGNICRSPTAAAVMRHEADAAGLGERIEIESAGTGGWHIGDPPDARAAAEARRRGIAMQNAASRFTRDDFDRFDLVLAMDRQNLGDLCALAPTPADRAKVRLLRGYAPGAASRRDGRENGSGDGTDVPDPYFGGASGFADVFEMIQAACRGLIENLRTATPPAPPSSA